MLCNVLFNNGPVGADLGCKGTGDWEYLPIPSRDRGCGVVDWKNVDFSVICYLFDLPDSAFDDEVEPNACLGNHEFLAEDAHVLLAREVYNHVSAFVGDHAQVFEIVEPGP